jgi:hypothetical protein
MDALAQLGPWFIVLTVVVMYSISFWAQSRGKKRWPPGHPWSGITLSLLAIQQLGWQFRILATDSLANKILSGIAMCTAVLWMWKGVQEYRTAKQDAAGKNDPDQDTKPPNKE